MPATTAISRAPRAVVTRSAISGEKRLCISRGLLSSLTFHSSFMSLTLAVVKTFSSFIQPVRAGVVAFGQVVGHVHGRPANHEHHYAESPQSHRLPHLPRGVGSEGKAYPMSLAMAGVQFGGGAGRVDTREA